MYFVRQMSTNVEFPPQLNPRTCHATSCYVGLEYAPNRLSAGALPQTPLERLQRSPDPLDVFRGLLLRKGEKDEGKRGGREGMERRERNEGKK